MIDPEIRAFGDVVVALWAGSRIVCEFARFSEHRDTLTAELTVSNEVGVLHWSRLNLAATNGRRDVVKALEEVHPIEEWRAMLDRACQLVARHLRIGEPEAPMVAAAPDPERWLVPGLIPLYETTIIYADGGSGKSLLALALAVSGLTGHALGGPWHVAPVKRVLYLDWESTRRAHEGRLWGLTRHLETPSPDALLHRRLWRPLTDEIAAIRTTVARTGVDLVVCDSLAPASGVDPEGANASTSTFNALASLDTATRIVLAHVSKASMEGARSAPYGSVFNRNLARSAIEVKPIESDDDGALTVSLYHRKINEGRQHGPSALTFTFGDDGAIDVRRAEPDMGGASLAAQVLDALKGGSQTVSLIAEALDANPSSVKTTLRRLSEKGKVIQLESVTGGKGKESQWGRKDTNRFT